MSTILVTAASSGFGLLTADAGHTVYAGMRHASLYDTNVLGAQRVNRRQLPAMRARGDGQFQHERRDTAVPAPVFGPPA